MRRSLLVGVVVGGLLLAVVAARHSILVKASTLSSPAWVPSTWSQALGIPIVQNTVKEKIPATIPQSLNDLDNSGIIGSYQPGGRTTTANNAFFSSGLGGSTNGRTCFSCHQPQDGWALKPSTVFAEFVTTNGRDPVFQPVDGSDCPSLVTAHQTSKQFMATRVQLFTKANIRIFLPVPTGLTAIAAANALLGDPSPTPWSSLTVSHDPYGCELSSTYGLNASPPFLSMYRRPLPSANLAFLDPVGPNGNQTGIIPSGLSPNGTGFAVMWDSREPTLESQFADAIKIHAQAPNPPTSTEVTEGVDFQTGLFTAQVYNNVARDLTGGDGSGATGGPKFLSSLFPLPSPIEPTFLGIPPFTPEFTLFEPAFVTPTTGSATTKAQRESIARGENLFTNKGFIVNGVAGLNEAVGPNAPSTCNTCHNIQNIGNNFALGPLHTGIGDNSSKDTLGRQGPSTTLPPTADLPLFTFACPSGSIPFFTNPDGSGHDIFQTTDPGMALLTGNCADLGKMKTPMLRGLAARAPYFHGGNAATLMDLMNFYDNRFSIGFTQQEKQDLVNFLNSL